VAGSGSPPVFPWLSPELISRHDGQRSRNGRDKLHGTWFLGVLFYASTAVMMTAAVVEACPTFLAVPKYRAERALGYTTWPPEEEFTCNKQ
jgi:hypothetical protein